MKLKQPQVWNSRCGREGGRGMEGIIAYERTYQSCTDESTLNFPQIYPEYVTSISTIVIEDLNICWTNSKNLTVEVLLCRRL